MLRMTRTLPDHPSVATGRTGGARRRGSDVECAHSRAPELRPGPARTPGPADGPTSFAEHGEEPSRHPGGGWQVTGQRGVPAGINIKALMRGPEKYAPEHRPKNLPAPVHGRGRGKGTCVPFGTDMPPVDRSGPMCPIGTLGTSRRQGGKPAIPSHHTYYEAGSLCARFSTRNVSTRGRVAPVHLVQRRGAPRVRNSQSMRRTAGDQALSPANPPEGRGVAVSGPCAMTIDASG